MTEDDIRRLRDIATEVLDVILPVVSKYDLYLWETALTLQMVAVAIITSMGDENVYTHSNDVTKH